MQTTPTATIPRRGHLYTIGVMNSPSFPCVARVERALALAPETLDIEAAAIRGLKSRLGPEFLQVVSLVLGNRGRVIVMGMGKSGTSDARSQPPWPARAPAFFVHPGEASHGDLGMVTEQDLVLPCPIRANQRNHHPVACTQTPGGTLGRRYGQ